MSILQPIQLPPNATRLETVTTVVGTSERSVYVLADATVASIQAILNQAASDGVPSSAQVNLFPTPTPPHISFSWGSS
jgi:hypothetical protein